jgi:hypothetical protein
MTPSQALDTAQALGFTLPTPAYIAGAVLFGLVGLAAWRFGRKRGQPRLQWLGAVLMFYPYLVPDTTWLWTVGCALCAALWWLGRG